MQVTAITDQAGMQDIGVNPGDFDDGEGGGGMVSHSSFWCILVYLELSWSREYNIKVFSPVVFCKSIIFCHCY